MRAALPWMLILFLVPSYAIFTVAFVWVWKFPPFGKGVRNAFARISLIVIKMVNIKVLLSFPHFLAGQVGRRSWLIAR